jgi:hypothetical protein
MRDDDPVRRRTSGIGAMWIAAALVVAMTACGVETATTEAAETSPQPLVATASEPGESVVSVPSERPRPANTVGACERFSAAAARIAADVDESTPVAVLSGTDEQCQLSVAGVPPTILTLLTGGETTEAEWITRHSGSTRSEHHGLTALAYSEQGQEAVALLGPGFTLALVGGVDTARRLAALDLVLGV